METKICSKCGKELPINEFYKNKNCKDGLSHWCKECFKEYHKSNKEAILEHQKQYHQKNRDRILERQKQYRQENRDRILEQHKQYRQENRDRILEHQKQYHQKNRDRILERQKQYYQTPIGRASSLAGGYRRSDKIYNRGECTLTAQWIVDNIFTSKCHWCKETDWHKLGCDRIDNSLPHTPDNVIPCCDECNAKRGSKTYEEFLMSLSDIADSIEEEFKD